MFYHQYRHILWSILLALLFVTLPAYAIQNNNFKVSSLGAGVQVWFEAEDFDERNPDTDEFYPVVDADGAFGQVVTRAGGAGGRISWSFDISAAGGTAGTWFFWYRAINPANQSDYMLVEGDPDDTEIPSTAPFPGGDGTAPFVNEDDRIFEENIGDPATATWGWARAGHEEGHTKELRNGVNTMHIYHRQGVETALWDVFMWTDDPDYVPSDADYESAPPAVAVEPAGKLAATWGKIKQAR